MVTGPWKDVSFVLVASNASSMNVTSLGLRRDTGISATDNTSSEGTIVGQIGFAGSGTSVSLTSLSNQRVEFDENGDDVIDGIAFTEADGKFQYTPKSLTPGAKTSVLAPECGIRRRIKVSSVRGKLTVTRLPQIQSYRQRFKRWGY